MADAAIEYLVDGVRIGAGDPAWQRLLESAHARGVQPRCLCRPGGVAMYIARYERHVVKRLPDTGHLHHPTCPSYEPPPGESGLGEVPGDAVVECAPDRIEVRVAFPLTRRVGRSAAAGDAGTPRTEVSAPRRRLGLRGLMHLLLQRAGFNRWSPRMQGRRNWFVFRRHLLAVAQEIETKGVRLGDVLFVPEPYSIDDATGIARRRAQALSILLSPGEGAQFRLMLVLSELKEFTATEVDHRIVLRHMPDGPLYMERRAGERLRKLFECEFEAWAHQRAAEQTGRIDPWRLRLLFCGLIYARREGVYFVDTATLVLLSSTWIPLDKPYEKLPIDELVRQQRRFVKPLRFESRNGASYPNAVLLDTGETGTALDIVTPFMPERDRGMKQAAIGRRSSSGWVWDMQAESEMPSLPQPATVAERDAPSTARPEVEGKRQPASQR